ncbi:MAG: hypothetical protein V4819_01845 [Verrucomicrobiota bacterium]
MVRGFVFALASLAIPLRAEAPRSLDPIARKILAPPLDPARIAKLKGDRLANARLYKVLGWLETARQSGGNIAAVIDTAQAAAGYGGTKAAAADKLAIT